MPISEFTNSDTRLPQPPPSGRKIIPCAIEVDEDLLRLTSKIDAPTLELCKGDGAFEREGAAYSTFVPREEFDDWVPDSTGMLLFPFAFHWEPPEMLVLWPAGGNDDDCRWLTAEDLASTSSESIAMVAMPSASLTDPARSGRLLGKGAYPAPHEGDGQPGRIVRHEPEALQLHDHGITGDGLAPGESFDDGLLALV